MAEYTEKAAAAEPYSLMRAIKQKIDGQEPEGIYKEMNERGKSEWSSQWVDPNAIYIPIQSTENILRNLNGESFEKQNAYTVTASHGQDIISTQFLNILPLLHNRLVLTHAGATITAGLKPNISFSFSAFKSAWVAENEEVPDDKMRLSDASDDLKEFRPHRLVSQRCLPKQLFDQDVLAFEPILRSYLVESIAQTLEGAILGNGQADKQPGGLFNGVTNAVEMSWSKIGKLTTSRDTTNALGKNCSYVMHPQLYGAAKTTINQTGAPMPIFLFDGQDTYMNGYRALCSNNIYADADNGKYGILFGSFEDLFIGQWGSLELVITKYPLKNDVKLSINSYWDAGLLRDSVMSKALFTIPAAKPVA